MASRAGFSLRWMVAGLAVLVAGCVFDGLPPPETAIIAPPPGVTLPLDGRVMIYMSETDLSRNLTIFATRNHTEETPVKDGQALERAAKTLLRKAFRTVETDDVSIRPHIVVKPVGKVTWARLDARMKIGCSLDAYTSDGFPIGNFSARFDSTSETDYRSELDAGYGLCLKKAMDDMLRSPTLLQLARNGFRDPDPNAVGMWMRSLGVIPNRR
jgi:hypothetical protein